MTLNFSNLTVLLVSFKSDEQILRLLSRFDKKINIIIVENSRNRNFKSFVEQKYKNVKVLVPKINKGWGSAINYAIKKTKTKYIMTLDCDISITNKNIYIDSDDEEINKNIIQTNIIQTNIIPPLSKKRPPIENNQLQNSNNTVPGSKNSGPFRPSSSELLMMKERLNKTKNTH